MEALLRAYRFSLQRVTLQQLSRTRLPFTVDGTR